MKRRWILLLIGVLSGALAGGCGEPATATPRQSKMKSPSPPSPNSLSKAECGRHRGMPQLPGSRRSDDHRIRAIICAHTQMPHHVFRGQTPEEVYFDQADRIHDRLRAARRQARQARMEANRGESCRVCTLPTQQSMSVINAVANAPP